MQKTIVYLDQNYYSHIAKARYGLIRDEGEASNWIQLFRNLKAAVMANKIGCPTSSFHDIETNYDQRLKDPILNTMKELSLGNRFLRWQDILELQIEDAARVFLGKPPVNNIWAAVFESDPQIPVENCLDSIPEYKSGKAVEMNLPDELIEANRQSKEEFVIEGLKHIEEYIKIPLDWTTLIRESKRSTIDGYMGVNARKDKAKLPRLLQLLDKLSRIGISPDNINLFVESEDLYNCTFIEIFSSYWAIIAEIQRKQDRKLRASDLYDVSALSIALPACDIIATDSFMKEISTKLLKFDEKYKVEIYSAAKTDLFSFMEYIYHC